MRESQGPAETSPRGVSRLLTPALLVLFLSIRLVLLIPAMTSPDRSLLPDSQGYLDLAESLRTKGTFEAGEYTEEIRTPGYPLFIAAVHSLTGPAVGPVVVAQALLSVGVAGIVYLTGVRAAGRSVGWAAAFLWALNPNSIFWPFTILSETIFAVLLAGSLLASVLALRSGSLKLHAVGGLVLGMAVLVRPIGIYLIPCWFVVLLIQGLRQRGWRLGWRPAGVLAVMAYSLVFAWESRNYFVRGEFFFSKTPEVTLRSYVLARALADARGVSRSEASQMISDTANLADLAGQIFAESPWSIPRVIVGGIVRTALGTEPETWLSRFGLPGSSRGLLTSILSGDWAQAKAALPGLFASRQNSLFGVLVMWGGLYALGVWLAALVGWLRFHSRLDWTGATAHWLAALSALYLVATPLANGDARFRMPVDPLLAFLGGVAWLGWRGLGRRHAHAEADGPAGQTGLQPAAEGGPAS